MYVYIKYDRKKPNLPVAIADTAAELAHLLGIQPNRVHSSLQLKLETYAKVWIDDDRLKNETNDAL